MAVITRKEIVQSIPDKVPKSVASAILELSNLDSRTTVDRNSIAQVLQPFLSDDAENNEALLSLARTYSCLSQLGFRLVGRSGGYH